MSISVDRASGVAVDANLAQPQPVRLPDHNRLGLDYRRPMLRPKVRGIVVDAHSHLVAARHAQDWFEAALHYGIDAFLTMTPLEEALTLQRQWGARIHFIAIPRWQDPSPNYEDWMRRLESFYNIGSRVIKFHMAPGSMHSRKWRLDSPQVRRIVQEAASRRMAVMTHIGDPEIWYQGKYADAQEYGSRDDHYRMWESVLKEYPADLPWIGAHLGGNPENMPRLQRLLDTYPNLSLDCSATRWMVREIALRRDEAREFFLRNQDRIVFGTDQVSGDERRFDFLASRFWTHRKLWETAHIGPSPIFDPDLHAEHQPILRGLALPDEVIQKMYHDNIIKLLAKVGARFDVE